MVYVSENSVGRKRIAGIRADFGTTRDDLGPTFKSALTLTGQGLNPLIDFSVSLDRKYIIYTNHTCHTPSAPSWFKKSKVGRALI